MKIPMKPSLATHGQKPASSLPFKPMNSQLQARVDELDPEHIPSVDTTQEDSTLSGDPDPEPDKLLAMVSMVHDVINMFPPCLLLMLTESFLSTELFQPLPTGKFISKW